MNATILTAKDIKECFQLLPDLTVSRLARETGVSYSWVSRAVNGHIFNRKVAEKLAEYLEKDIALKNRIHEFKQQAI